MTSKIDNLISFTEKTLTKEEKVNTLKNLIRTSKRVRNFHLKYKLKDKLDKIDEFLPILIDISLEEKNDLNSKLVTTLFLDRNNNFISLIENNLEFKSNFVSLIDYQNLFPYEIGIFDKEFEKNSKKYFEKSENNQFEQIFFNEVALKKFNKFGIYKINEEMFSETRNEFLLNIAYLFLKKNKKIIFTTFKKLAETLDDATSYKTRNDFIADLKKIDGLFILDAYLGSFNKKSVDEIFWNVFLERIQDKKLTFISSNLQMEEFSFIVTVYSHDKIGFIDHLYKQLREDGNFFFKVQKQEFLERLKMLIVI
ncbi:hypothetical protein [[Mycoplasma] mobile]|uniref:Expressed protein n=1 Tax=Mycoplasma mobile (strain ATCC 43663 / 163K / NCTC 11711) TaxID=267748 RepID=Q6KIA4_MYCM1|nr:hypothetical protein [[Mycoplasma] mobile]AAT27672.1 expressed protein [Mycoplasma mobile 163K]